MSPLIALTLWMAAGGYVLGKRNGKQLDVRYLASLCRLLPTLPCSARCLFWLGREPAGIELVRPHRMRLPWSP